MASRLAPGIPYTPAVGSSVAGGDELVAFAASDLNEHGLFGQTGFAEWSTQMQAPEELFFHTDPLPAFSDSCSVPEVCASMRHHSKMQQLPR